MRCSNDARRERDVAECARDIKLVVELTLAGDISSCLADALSLERFGRIVLPRDDTMTTF